jgi:hypothetical protein
MMSMRTFGSCGSDGLGSLWQNRLPHGRGFCNMMILQNRDREGVRMGVRPSKVDENRFQQQ